MGAGAACVATVQSSIVMVATRTSRDRSVDAEGLMLRIMMKQMMIAGERGPSGTSDAATSERTEWLSGAD